MASKLMIPPKPQFVHLIDEPIPAVLPGTSRIKIPASYVYDYLNLLISGSFAIANVNGVLTPEGILSLISEVRLIGTSKTGRNVGTFKQADLAAMYRLRQFMNHGAGYRLDPTPINVGDTPPFAFDLQLDFMMEHSNKPRATLLNGASMTALTLEIDWRPLTDVFSAGTITGSNIQVAVGARQYVDPRMQAAPYGLNVLTMQEKPVVAATADFNFEFKRKGLLRGIFIKTFTRNAVVYHTPVDTVVNRIEVLADKRVQKTFPSWQYLRAENQQNYKITPPAGYAFVDFMSDGQFDSIFDQRKHGDVELKMNVNAIANSVVRVYPVEVQL